MNKSLEQLIGGDPSAVIKDLGREMKKPTGEVRRAIRAFIEYAYEKAQDHEAFYRSFCACWEGAIAEIKAASTRMLSDPGVIVMAVRNGSSPCSSFSILRFRPLMDNLSYEEELDLGNLADALDAAWAEYLGVLKLRLPRYSAEIETLGEFRSILQREALKLYLGEIEPALTVEWKIALSAMTKLEAEISKGVEDGISA